MPAAAPHNGVLEDAEDLLYEEDLQRNAFSLKHWLRYLDAKRRAPAQARYVVYERALKALPGSYKLWRAYLLDRVEACKGRSPLDPACQQLVRVFERALVYMHKMPRVWTDYLELLPRLIRPTHTRRAFDRALQSLPITQHDRIWPLYLRFVRGLGVPETAVRVYRRYLQFDPDAAEDYVDYLVSVGRVGEAAEQLVAVLDRDGFASPRGNSRHTLWLRLCRLIAEHPRACAGKVRGEAIIRGGLREFSDEVGQIWTALADFFLRQGQFEQARDVYEEAATTVNTVRDFSLVFDAYAQFEELMATTRMEAAAKAEAEAEGAEGQGGEEAAARAAALTDARVDLDMALARFERLTERRPELLSSVKLRQNPHNVREWLHRVRLFSEDPARAIQTFATAVKSVDPQQAVGGKLSALWVAFAAFYEAHGDLRNARAILRKATDVAFKTVDELASVWLEAAEMELRHREYQRALDLLRAATAAPPPHQRSKQALESGPIQRRLFKCTRVWQMRADLEESLAPVEEARRCYEQMFDLKVITPQLVLGLAAFLEERNYFEQSFQAYERGVATFSFPYAKELWDAYLAKFVDRYGGSKLERGRDLFEQCLEQCPPAQAAHYYRRYAAYELEHGLVRHAMKVLERGTTAVDPAGRADLFRMHIQTAAEHYGVTRCRDIYERAIGSLPDEAARLMCLEYAALETKLGEVARARAIYTHGAQMYDPKTEAQLWAEWQAFEVEQGNEDTFREMLRVKRAVKAQYANATTGPEPAAGPGATGSEGGAAATAQGGEFEASSRFMGMRRGFVFKLGPKGLGYYGDPLAALSQPVELGPAPGPGPDGPGPVDAEHAGEGDQNRSPVAGADDGGQDAGVAIKQRPVPDAVFGSAAQLAGNKRAPDEPVMGALERFKRQK